MKMIYWSKIKKSRVRVCLVIDKRRAKNWRVIIAAEITIWHFAFTRAASFQLTLSAANKILKIFRALGRTITKVTFKSALLREGHETDIFFSSVVVTLTLKAALYKLSWSLHRLNASRISSSIYNWLIKIADHRKGRNTRRADRARRFLSRSRHSECNYCEHVTREVNCLVQFRRMSWIAIIDRWRKNRQATRELRLNSIRERFSVGHL